MMLVDAEAVEAHLVGELELIEIVVVEAMAEFGIIEIARDVNPDTAILVLEIFGQIPIRHQMKPGEFHTLSPWRRRSAHALRYRESLQQKPIDEKRQTEHQASLRAPLNQTGQIRDPFAALRVTAARFTYRRGGHQARAVPGIDW